VQGAIVGTLEDITLSDLVETGRASAANAQRKKAAA